MLMVQFVRLFAMAFILYNRVKSKPCLCPPMLILENLL